MSARKAHLTYRVPYAETDRMGVVYYANYLVYFERARTQLLHDLGLPYRELERRGTGLPVIEAHVDYKAPAEYDDELDLYAWVGWLKNIRLRIDCAVLRNGRLLAEGYTVHACFDLDARRPVRLPPELQDAIRRAHNEDS